jgi:hypothetical protein
MKKLSLLTLVFTILAYCGQAQDVKFSKADQENIQKVLGKDYTAVLSRDGQLAIVTPKSVGEITSAPRGGFSKLPGNAASVTFAAYEKAWVYKKDTKDILKSRLGEERFKQLSAIMKAKGVTVQ